MRRFRTAGSALLLALTAGPMAAAAQTQERGLVVTADAMRLDIGGRVQTQLNTTSVEDEPDAQILLRRARLELDLQVNELVSGRLQTEFGGERVSIRDAYLRLNFSPALGVLAGKAYRPFSLLEQTSSIRILPIERGLAIRGVDGLDQYDLVHDLHYSDRDVGFQVLGAPEGAPLGLTYAAGVFAGPSLPGRPANISPFQLAARATVSPVSGARVGAGWSSRAFSPNATTAAERGHAFEVDLELGGFDPGLHFLGEVTTGDFDPFDDTTFRGAQGWLGYRTGSMGRVSTIEPILRVSYSDVEDDGEAGGTLFTPGVNIYFGGYNRVMFNYDLWSPTGDGDTEGSFKTQFQLVF